MELTKAIPQFLTFLRVECGLAANTLTAYRADLRDLVTFLQPVVEEPASTSMKLEDITGRMLTEHLRSLKTDRNLAATSIIRHLATLRMFFRFATAERWVERNPAELLERPTRWQRLPGCLSPVQMRKVLNAPNPDQGELWLRDRCMLELMYAAGLRASEVGHLDVSDYHETLGILNVIGKGDKQRLVPIGKPAVDATNAYLAQLRPVLVQRCAQPEKQTRLLLSRTGRPIERIAVWQIVRRQAMAAGVRDVHPHILRHSFATHLVSGGANLRVVQELLGHADIRTTQTYTHVDTTRLRDIHRKFHPRS